MYKETDSALLVTMTRGELKDLIAELLGEAMKDSALSAPLTPSGNYVYGLRGIEQLFGVSHKTAQAYKDGIIKEAVRQHGRKASDDVDQIHIPDPVAQELSRLREELTELRGQVTGASAEKAKTED